MLQPLLEAAAAGGRFEGAIAPRRIELTCHLALAAAGWLERAHDALAAQTGTLDDTALRAGWLAGVPAHRGIAARWQARAEGGAPASPNPHD